MFSPSGDTQLTPWELSPDRKICQISPNTSRGVNQAKNLISSSPTCPLGTMDLFKKEAVNSNPPTAHSSSSLELAEPWYHTKKPKSSTAACARLQLTQGHIITLEGN